MSNRIYLITIDPTDPSADHARLKAFFKAGSPHIDNWWNHIPHVFMVSTDLDADAISELIRPFAGRARFLVIEVQPEESEGSLPERAWRWIQKRSRHDEMANAN
ncbi:MAG TPA: hypothetical protein VGG99_18180 [Acetobacteraceae bacterium]|jgi:hypothetical protein